MNKLIDSHCHIQFQSFKDNYQEVIKRCQEKECKMLTVGTQKNTAKIAVDFASKYDNIYAIVGLHPIHTSCTEVDEEETHFVSKEEDCDKEYYRELAKHPKVVGIGECGIDLFHIPKDISKEEVLHKQTKGFTEQIELANELDLPISIHIRDAYQEVLDIIKKNNLRFKGVVHCYSGNWEYAKQFLDMGLYLGFTGIITFPERKTNPQPHFDLLEVVEKCPLDRILIETDAPYLAPQKYRGKQCEPWMVEEVLAKIAKIKQIDLETARKTILENTTKLYSKITI